MKYIDRRTFVVGATALGASAALGGTLAGCNSDNEMVEPEGETPEVSENPELAPENVPEEIPAPSQDSTDSVPVYFTDDISPDGLMAVYRELAWNPEGSVAVKVTTGEPGGHNFLQPDFIKGLVDEVSGTIIECNTAYGGSRSSTQSHYQVAEDHGFTAIAAVDIMDENGSESFAAPNGSHLPEVLVGANIGKYQSFISLAHFKGHAMGGFGGAIKNVSIGMSSSAGKYLIHSAGETSTSWRSAEQDSFLESMAEATKAIADGIENKIIYINVMNRLSVDCDCDSNPAEPDMMDIGILASYDPVAVDQACVDLVYAAEDGQSLKERIESRNGIHTLEHAASIGLGSREYNLIKL